MTHPDDKRSALTREQRTELSKLWSREPNLTHDEYARRDELEEIMRGNGPARTAPTAAVVAKALASKIAGELGATEGSSERMQAERIIAAELDGLLDFVERCFGSTITSAGESVFEETIRADAGKLLRELAPTRVPMIGRDYNLVRHVLEGSAPWAIDYLHNRDLWAVRQELPSAVLAHRSSPYYTRLLSIAEERREAQEAATS